MTNKKLLILLTPLALGVNVESSAADAMQTDQNASENQFSQEQQAQAINDAFGSNAQEGEAPHEENSVTNNGEQVAPQSQSDEQIAASIPSSTLPKTETEVAIGNADVQNSQQANSAESVTESAPLPQEGDGNALLNKLFDDNAQSASKDTQSNTTEQNTSNSAGAELAQTKPVQTQSTVGASRAENLNKTTEGQNSQQAVFPQTQNASGVPPQKEATASEANTQNQSQQGITQQGDGTAPSGKRDVMTQKVEQGVEQSIPTSDSIHTSFPKTDSNNTDDTAMSSQLLPSHVVQEKTTEATFAQAGMSPNGSSDNAHITSVDSNIADRNAQISVNTTRQGQVTNQTAEPVAQQNAVSSDKILLTTVSQQPAPNSGATSNAAAPMVGVLPGTTSTLQELTQQADNTPIIGTHSGNFASTVTTGGNTTNGTETAVQNTNAVSQNAVPPTQTHISQVGHDKTKLSTQQPIIIGTSTPETNVQVQSNASMQPTFGTQTTQFAISKQVQGGVNPQAAINTESAKEIASDIIVTQAQNKIEREDNRVNTELKQVVKDVKENVESIKEVKESVSTMGEKMSRIQEALDILTIALTEKMDIMGDSSRNTKLQNSSEHEGNTIKENGTYQDFEISREQDTPKMKEDKLIAEHKEKANRNAENDSENSQKVAEKRKNFGSSDEDITDKRLENVSKDMDGKNKETKKSLSEDDKYDAKSNFLGDKESEGKFSEKKLNNIDGEQGILSKILAKVEKIEDDNQQNTIKVDKKLEILDSKIKELDKEGAAHTKADTLEEKKIHDVSLAEENGKSQSVLAKDENVSTQKSSADVLLDEKQKQESKKAKPVTVANRVNSSSEFSAVEEEQNGSKQNVEQTKNTEEPTNSVDKTDNSTVSKDTPSSAGKKIDQENVNKAGVVQAVLSGVPEVSGSIVPTSVTSTQVIQSQALNENSADIVQGKAADTQSVNVAAQQEDMDKNTQPVTNETERRETSQVGSNTDNAKKDGASQSFDADKTTVIATSSETKTSSNDADSEGKPQQDKTEEKKSNEQEKNGIGQETEALPASSEEKKPVKDAHGGNSEQESSEMEKTVSSAIVDKSQSSFSPATVAVNTSDEIRSLESLSEQLVATAKVIETVRLGIEQQQK